MTAAKREEIDFLRELRLFRGMAEDNFEALLQPAFLQRFPPHVVLIRQGDPADFLHIVLDGLLEHFAVHEQREYGLFLSGPGEVFPLASGHRGTPLHRLRPGHRALAGTDAPDGRIPRGVRP